MSSAYSIPNGVHETLRVALPRKADLMSLEKNEADIYVRHLSAMPKVSKWAKGLGVDQGYSASKASALGSSLKSWPAEFMLLVYREVLIFL